MSVCWRLPWCGSPLLCCPRQPPKDGPQVVSVHSHVSLCSKIEISSHLAKSQPLLGLPSASKFPFPAPLVPQAASFSVQATALALLTIAQYRACSIRLLNIDGSILRPANDHHFMHTKLPSL